MVETMEMIWQLHHSNTEAAGTSVVFHRMLECSLHLRIITSFNPLFDVSNFPIQPPLYLLPTTREEIREVGGNAKAYNTPKETETYSWSLHWAFLRCNQNRGGIVTPTGTGE